MSSPCEGCLHGGDDDGVDGIALGRHLVHAIRRQLHGAAAHGANQKCQHGKRKALSLQHVGPPGIANQDQRCAEGKQARQQHVPVPYDAAVLPNGGEQGGERQYHHHASIRNR
jgi:hypothetical protein